ncbi:MAG: hypothetical protein LBP74_05220 [Treponema sp.]|jgi:hypothetical protein|nr:hypothetical protein [Treponema sp.]
MKKFAVLIMFPVFLTACSNPLLKWIDMPGGSSPNTGNTGAGINLYGASAKGITFFSFGFGDAETDTIRQSPSGAGGKIPITVILPALPPGSAINNLAPDIDYIGKSIDPGSGEAQDFSSPVTYRITAEDGSWREYLVEVIVKENTSAEIKWFDLELPGVGSYMAEGVVDSSTTVGTVSIHVPSRTDITSPLAAKVVHTGKTLSSLSVDTVYITPNTEPEITLTDIFSPPPVRYTVTAEDGMTTKDYDVTVIKDKSSDTGISTFEVSCHLKGDPTIFNPQVVIGEKPRTKPNDGRIPIVIQVPYGTDESDMKATITLSDPLSSVNPVASGSPIPFGNKGNNKEAVYTVTAENNATQEYVALVSAGPQYYYVDGVNGDDEWPDVYNGGSESLPFRTLANAVKQAAIDGIPKVLIMGDLNALNGGSSGDSTFAIDLSSLGSTANKKITIASNVTGGTRKLTAGSGQRVLSISGGADLTFENINVTGGNFAGNGGGIYVTGNSKVDFTGNITGNTAKSGGGVYLEAGTGVSDYSTFTLTSGTIANNHATGTGSGALDVNDMDGGGGVYIKGNAIFTLRAAGAISNNTAVGSGGGVLINGNVIPGSPPDEYGLIMDDNSKITGNTSTGATYPQGGGGVYVAQGAFEMYGGEVTSNIATRQGGGVFVHWANSPALTARFTASGDSVITGNTGVGSSKAICNRGITELTGSARADYVYVWDYGDASIPQSFTLANNTRIDVGIAFARVSASAPNNNFITLVNDGTNDYNTADYVAGVRPSILIDLESHLNGGIYTGTTPDTDWLGTTLITGANTTLTDMLPFLVLNTFKGSSLKTQLYKDYEIEVLPGATVGTFEQQ